jgi:hypothetical protein
MEELATSRSLPIIHPNPHVPALRINILDLQNQKNGWTYAMSRGSTRRESATTQASADCAFGMRLLSLKTRPETSYCKETLTKRDHYR